jgi:hypothetical protein
VQTGVAGVSSTANDFPKGTSILRGADNNRIQLNELIAGKEVPRESGRGHILNLLGLRQQKGSPTTFNRNLLPFPLYVGEQWQFKYRTRVTNVVSCEVVAEQNVATQAGNFRALRIERNNQ